MRIVASRILTRLSILTRMWRLPLLFETAWQMLRAYAEIRLLPFDRIAVGIAAPVAGASLAEHELHAADLDAAREVRGAVHAISRRLPSRPTCLVRAVTAHRMLRSRGVASTVVLSVAADADRDEVQAHAWLEAAGMVVTGRDEQAKFTPIYRIGQSRTVAAAEGRGSCLP